MEEALKLVPGDRLIYRGTIHNTGKGEDFYLRYVEFVEISKRSFQSLVVKGQTPCGIETMTKSMKHLRKA